ncbi:biotin--[acetyl-CoA-carboxylase] ligase [Maritalea myrionectae]|uniref:Biotin--[acetyl-CoA-carboxylase] ligase n=1 Tax=Maritalea myrionectae TaxID=454601 RepID=A0A2R4MEV1_9HYPH|nr:biotin--[acetyl-CoA-carboxylase] ligase [Maritalea myrionectae]AVX04571.1 biotin--[acetyl-CoA-carboxylase] ligase [Maritalea myrionectae]
MVSLGERARLDGFQLRHVPTIGSTSATLMQDALNGAIGPVWLVADQQEDGKGRRGRFWHSPPGNLYSSLLLTEPAPSEYVAQLSFVMALALYDAVCAVAAAQSVDGLTIELKWPNDLMINGKKCAGLLLEGGMKGQSRFVVIGMGVNLAFHPDQSNHPASDFASLGLNTSPAHFFAFLSDAVAQRLGQWARGNNFAEIRADWLSHAYKMGEVMRINANAESYEARLEGVDPTGGLIVDHMGRQRIVTAGEIFNL